MEPPREEVHMDLTLEGDFDSFDTAAREKLLDDLSKELGVDRDLIEIGPCEAGSIKCKIIIKQPPSGTPGPPLQSLQAKATTLAGRSLGGYPCREVKKPVVVVQPPEPKHNTRAEASEREVARLKAELKQLLGKNEYLRKNLEAAEAIEDETPPDMSTARNKISDLEVEIMKCELESKGKDDLIRSVRLSLNQAQKDHAVREQDLQEQLRTLQSGVNAAPVEEADLRAKLLATEDANTKLQRVVDNMSAEVSMTEGKLEEAEQALERYERESAGESEAKLVKAQEAYLEEMSLIKAAEAEEKKMIRQRYCFKSIQAVMARLTRGVTAACIVRWRMEMAKDVDTAVASEVAGVEKEFADKCYEQEREDMGKRVDEAEKALLDKASHHQAERDGLQAELEKERAQTSALRQQMEAALSSAEHGKNDLKLRLNAMEAEAEVAESKARLADEAGQLQRSQLEADIEDARREMTNLKELHTLHESKGDVHATRVSQLENELGEMRGHRDRSLSLEAAMEASEKDKRFALQRSGIKMLKATLMRMRAAGSASCLFEWRRKMEAAGYILHHSQEMAREEAHAVKLLEFQATLERSRQELEATSKAKGELASAFQGEIEAARRLHEDSLLAARTEMASYKERCEGLELKEKARRQKLLDAGCVRLKVSLARVHKGRVAACVHVWSTSAVKGVGSLQLEELKQGFLKEQEQDGVEKQAEMTKLQGEFNAAQTEFEREVTAIKAAEARGAMNVQQRASLKNIQAAMSRITRGIVAECVVNWRMESVVALDLAKARQVAERELAAAQEGYEEDTMRVRRELKLELASMQQRVDDAEASRSQSAADLEGQHRGRIEEQTTEHSREMADLNEGHAIAYRKLQQQHEEDIREHQNRIQSQSASFDTLAKELEREARVEKQLSGVKRVGATIVRLAKGRLAACIHTWRAAAGGAKATVMEFEMVQLQAAQQRGSATEARLRRSTQLGKVQLLWFHYVSTRRATLTSLLATWRDQLMCDVANAMMGGYAGELDSEYIDADSDTEMTQSHVDAGTVGRLWSMLLALDERRGGVGSGVKEMRLDMFLRVCAVYAPEVSTVGIRETLLSLGLRDGLISEEVFKQWMSIMFTGCNDVELQYGVAELIDAVNKVDGDLQLQASGRSY